MNSHNPPSESKRASAQAAECTSAVSTWASARARSGSGDAMLASVASPDPDRARALAHVLTADVHSAAWALARFDSEGGLCEFIAHPDGEDSPLNADALQAETMLQTREGTTAPAVATTKIALAPLRFGLTVLYGHRQQIV